MNIQTLTLGPLATNCYLVRQRQHRIVIIDPAANSKRLLPLWRTGTDAGGYFADARAF